MPETSIPVAEQRTSSSAPRRALMKGVAWSLPALAVSTIAPAVAASPQAPVRGIRVEGQCGLLGLGLAGRGFTIEAGPDPIPAGTRITLTDNAGLNVGAVSLSDPELAGIQLLSPGTVVVTLEQPLPSGMSIRIGWLLSLSAGYRADAVLELPDGYAAEQSKLSGNFRVLLLIGCARG